MSNLLVVRHLPAFFLKQAKTVMFSLVVGLLAPLVLLSTVSALPIVVPRDNDTPQHDISGWVSRLIIIGLVFFFAVLASFYLYSKLKPKANAPSTPVYAQPMRSRPIDHPVMGKTRLLSSLHRPSSSTSSSSPLTQASFPLHQMKEKTEYPAPAHIRTSQ